MYANRAFLRFNQGLYEGAIEDAAAARKAGSTAELDLLCLRSMVELGRFKEAREKAVELMVMRKDRKEEADSRSKMAQLAEIAGLCSIRMGEPGDGEKYLTDSITMDPQRPGPFFARAVLYHQTGQYEKAEEDFSGYLALVKSPPSVFWADYAVTMGKLANYMDGTHALENALQRHPYDIDSLEEAGYQNMKQARNRDARDNFARAIDIHTGILPYLPGDEKEVHESDRTALKREYTKLDKGFGLQAYFSKTDYQLGDESVFSSIDGALPSQAGIEGSIRPPFVGFRNEKTVDIFGRVLANFEPDSWDLDKESYQGGAGIRVKPFREWNLNVSLEKLFKIGDDSEDNLLLRGLGSMERGGLPGGEAGLTTRTKLYGEAGVFLQNPERWFYYLDGRAGLGLNVSPDIVITVPELMAVRRWESDTASNVDNYWLAGAGFNIRVYDDEDDYTVGRWYIDAFAHYTFGWFDEKPAGLTDESFDGIVFGINLVK